jgi:protease-4
MMQANIEDGYSTFVSHVAEGRRMTVAQVDSIGQGRVWSGENAKEIGLIDDFGGLKDAIALAAEIEGLDEYRTVDLPALPDPFQELFKVGTDNIRARFLKNELGETYRYFEYFKKMSGMNGVYARMPYDIFIN